jgi:cell division protein FtsZ
MVFISAGLGGGTGTGAAPIIAEVAKEVGALTVGVVTKPFSREGKRRMQMADQGAAQLKEVVDSLIVVPNDRLLGLAGKNMSILDAFKPSDDVLRQAVQPFWKGCRSWLSRFSICRFVVARPPESVV